MTSVQQSPWTPPAGGVTAPVPEGVPVQPSPHGSSSIRATNVSAWFGSKKVLERVTLTMQPSRVTALIGPSGCGKSTFLRILNRMHELVPSAPLSGDVLLDGDDIYVPTARVTETRRGIGMVFQRRTFPVHDHRPERVRRAAAVRHQGRNPRRPWSRTALNERPLERDPRTGCNEAGGALSGGQQQRLCIARARRPGPVLLMDEPCSALDPISTGVSRRPSGSCVTK